MSLLQTLHCYSSIFIFKLLFFNQLYHQTVAKVKPSKTMTTDSLVFAIYQICNLAPYSVHTNTPFEEQT